MKSISRRSALCSVTMLPLLGTSDEAPKKSASDVGIIKLGPQFDALAAELDHAIDHGANIAWETLEKFDRILTEIIATPATTMEGLCVKARVACWARLGDLDAGEQCTAEDRVVLSMIRDLIRLYYPHLERPGALRKLVEDTEQNARRS